MNNEHFDRLSRMSGADYGNFVRHRRQLIGQMIDRNAASQPALLTLQQEIDCRLALAVTPRRSIDELMALLVERVAALHQLSLQLQALPHDDARQKV